MTLINLYYVNCNLQGETWTMYTDMKKKNRSLWDVTILQTGLDMLEKQDKCSTRKAGSSKRYTVKNQVYRAIIFWQRMCHGSLLKTIHTRTSRGKEQETKDAYGIITSKRWNRSMTDCMYAAQHKVQKSLGKPAPGLKESIWMLMMCVSLMSFIIFLINGSYIMFISLPIEEAIKVQYIYHDSLCCFLSIVLTLFHEDWWLLIFLHKWPTMSDFLSFCRW